jgi:acyl carrier protein
MEKTFYQVKILMEKFLHKIGRKLAIEMQSDLIKDIELKPQQLQYFLLQIESTFEIEISENEAKELSTIESICFLIQSKIN